MLHQSFRTHLESHSFVLMSIVYETDKNLIDLLRFQFLKNDFTKLVFMAKL